LNHIKFNHTLTLTTLFPQSICLYDVVSGPVTLKLETLKTLKTQKPKT